MQPRRDKIRPFWLTPDSASMQIQHHKQRMAARPTVCFLAELNDNIILSTLSQLCMLQLVVNILQDPFKMVNPPLDCSSIEAMPALRTKVPSRAS